jgi:hypothetical protein
MRENAALCIVGTWRRGGHATPHCCAIQCLPRNLARHGAERREGEGRRSWALRKYRSLLLRKRVSRFVPFNGSRMGPICHTIVPFSTRNMIESELRGDYDFLVFERSRAPIQVRRLDIMTEAFCGSSLTPGQQNIPQSRTISSFFRSYQIQYSKPARTKYNLSLLKGG